jgi:cyclic pyranopterin phosphate synthase
MSSKGKANMVDISEKVPVRRQATATGIIRLKASTINLLKLGKIEKGDVFAVARIAAIMAAKRTSEAIPLCHPIPLEQVSADFEVEPESVRATVTVKASGKTGVEMEALHGLSLALLTIWDMTKGYEKDEAGQYPNTSIQHLRVQEKLKSGDQA